MIIIQHIRTQWTKDSRGAPKATARNQVPKSFLIDGHAEKSSEIYVHYIAAHEENGFQPEEKFYPLKTYGFIENKASKNKHYLNITFFGDVDKWTFISEKELQGLWGPIRPKQQIFNLKKDEWGCLLLNHRYSGSEGAYGEISYSQDVFNIVNFDQFDPAIFMNHKPKYNIDRLEQLF